jgi:type IV pilus assembly protein PilM
VRFACSIPISADQLTLAIANELSIKYNEAEDLKIKQGLLEEGKGKRNLFEITKPILQDLASQIKKYMNFYHDHVYHEYFPSDGKLEKIVLCGGGANLKGLADFLSKELGVKVELADPFVNIFLPKTNEKYRSLNKKSLSFAAALGLALRNNDTQDNLKL